jgi:hypothetical protein
MFTNVRMIIAGVLALALLASGYALGARKVHSLEDQLKSIEVAANDAKARLDKSQQEMAATIRAKEI